MTDLPYDRLRGAFRAFVDELFPRQRFLTGYQFTVQSCDFGAQTADMSPVNAALGLPDLVAIPIRSPLLMVKLTPGDVVVVSFEDGDPSFPYVSGLPSGAGAIPVVRQGDVCWVGAAVKPATYIGALPGEFTLVLDPSQLGPPPVPPPAVPAGAAAVTTKLYGIAASGSQSVSSK